MVARAKELATSDLMFVTDLSEGEQSLGKIHLLHSSGTLQYLPDPLKALSQLTSLEANVMLLSRLGLTEGESYTTIQRVPLSANGPGPLPAGVKDGFAAYPVTFINRRTLEDIVCHNYVILAHYYDNSSDYKTPREDINGSCYLLVHR
jgi:putative methyltransferase (TIGR04325 family)